MAESLSAPQECLEYLGEIHWKSSFPHSASTKQAAELDEVIKAFQSEVQRRERSMSMDLEESDAIPDEFLDPIVMTIMEVRNSCFALKFALCSLSALTLCYPLSNTFIFDFVGSSDSS